MRAGWISRLIVEKIRDTSLGLSCQSSLSVCLSVLTVQFVSLASFQISPQNAISSFEKIFDHQIKIFKIHVFRSYQLCVSVSRCYQHRRSVSLCISPIYCSVRPLCFLDLFLVSQTNLFLAFGFNHAQVGLQSITEVRHRKIPTIALL